jgi:hypothetical protein
LEIFLKPSVNPLEARESVLRMEMRILTANSKDHSRKMGKIPQRISIRNFSQRLLNLLTTPQRIMPERAKTC